MFINFELYKQLKVLGVLVNINIALLTYSLQYSQILS